MGVSIDTGGGGGKRPLDAELNLVPFIDLLVCCICFLLITAVWTQLAQVEVSQKGKSSAAESEDKPPEVQIQVGVLVGADGYTLMTGPDRLVLEKEGEAYPQEKLAEKLKEVRAELPEDHPKDITIYSEDGIPFKHVVETMDIALRTEFGSLKLKDATAAM